MSESTPGISPQNPWLGLSSFTEETARYFFGREREIAEIHSRIRENSLTILYGRSGLGKTSLLGAGLTPQLDAEGSSTAVTRLRYGNEFPSLLVQTKQALSSALGAELPADLSLWEWFHRKPVPLSASAPPPILIFDQFEDWKLVLPQLMQNRMALQPLRGTQALEAVVGPASFAAPPLTSPSVAAAIVRTAARVEADTELDQIHAVPPILSLLCEQLNEARIRAGDEHIDAQLVAEHSADILDRFYEESFDSFSEDDREAVRTLIEDKMVTVGGFRNPVATDDAEAHLKSLGVSDPATIFRRLIARRLITAEDRGVTRLTSG